MNEEAEAHVHGINNNITIPAPAEAEEEHPADAALLDADMPASGQSLPLLSKPPLNVIEPTQLLYGLSNIRQESGEDSFLPDKHRQGRSLPRLKKGVCLYQYSCRHCHR